MTYNTSREKYCYLVDIAIMKLCGRTLNWTKHWQQSGIALLACTTCIYVCPLSCMARDLVKSHMTTIITVDDSDKKNLIGYRSEPMLSEVALTLLSRAGIELDVLKELGSVEKEGGVIDTGNQGEICTRILLLSARRRQILSFRKHCKSYPAFFTHLSVTAYLQELFSTEFSHQNFKHLEAYDIRFTHFIALKHTPDESTLQLSGCESSNSHVPPIREKACNIKYTSIHFFYSQLQPLYHALKDMVKNHARPESKSVLNYAIGDGLRTSTTLCETCVHVENDSIGMYIQIGEAYVNKPQFKTYYYGKGTNQSKGMKLSFVKKANRPTEFKFICKTFPVIYSPHAIKRAKLINDDNDEDAKNYLINKKWKSDELVKQYEEIEE
ncbi:6545_t:CDS:2, partial [Funneliformis geosporum]